MVFAVPCYDFEFQLLKADVYNTAKQDMSISIFTFTVFMALTDHRCGAMTGTHHVKFTNLLTHLICACFSKEVDLPWDGKYNVTLKFYTMELLWN